MRPRSLTVFSGLVRTDSLADISASPLTDIKRHLKDFTHLVCVSQQTLILLLSGMDEQILLVY